VASQKNTSIITSGKSIQVIHDLLSTEANGNNLSEYVVQTSTGTAITRGTTTAITKDNTKEVTTTTTFFVDTN